LNNFLLNEFIFIKKKYQWGTEGLQLISQSFNGFAYQKPELGFFE